LSSWPEPKAGAWSEAVRKAKAHDAEQSWCDKIGQAFFRGSFMVPLRRKLWDVAHTFSWSNISEVDWGNKQTIVTLDDHCGYKYLMHAEGWAYSGRLKYLLQCKSVVISHEMEYLQHYNHLVRGAMRDPQQNMVVVPGQEWQDLPKTMKELLEDDGFARELAERQ
jgi:hypothetical protein